MAEKQFYVGSIDRNTKRLNGYVRSRVFTLDGQPVVDPTTGGSQGNRVYADDQGHGATEGKLANPNNYLIVPGNFTEQQARDYARGINETRSIPVIGAAMARARMGVDFRPGGSQDLQRDPQWGISPGSFVPAFISSASHYLGLVGGLTDTPLDLVEWAGGHTNGGKNQSGPHGVSQQNHANLLKGYADAKPNVERLTGDFGYGSPGQAPAGRIGDGQGVADWVSSLSGVDPLDPTQPVPQHQAAALPGLVSNKPMPRWPVPPPIFDTPH